MRLSRNKYPAQVISVELDWVDWLGSDTLVGSPTVTVDDDSGLTIDNIHTASNVTTFLVGGGTAKGTGLVTVTAQAYSGKIEPIYLLFKILDTPKETILP